MEKGDLEGAREAFENSIKLGKRLNLPAETASAYVEFGLLLEDLGDKDGAKGCFKQAQALYQGVRLDKELAVVKRHLERLAA